MKNYNSQRQPRMFATIALAATAIPFLGSCDFDSRNDMLPPAVICQSTASLSLTPESVARMLSEIPITIEQVREVHQGTAASSANGYDEEYTFSDMLSCPGRGVGDDLSGTRSEGLSPGSLGQMVSYHIAGSAETRSSGLVGELASSGLQIYWPYSEDWDGTTMPVITFCPEMALDSNVGFVREELPGGQWIVREIVVDEAYAMKRPVWVVNRNEDAGAMTPQILSKTRPDRVETRAVSDLKTLRIKEFKAHVQYDPWLSGGSEFFIKCGSIKAFTATVASDLSHYTPEITDLMIKVKRKQVGTAMRLNTVLVSEWSPQLSECVFLIHEDDGGKSTTWKASGEVKIKSKAYGFSVELPYHRNDDIVWRGKLSSTYFEKYNGIANRYGDTSITFTFN